MKVTILQFPGTNCEYDTQYAFEKLGATTEILWHKSENVPDDTDLLVVAGGFSYGDYLRSGAIAKISPVMKMSGKSFSSRLTLDKILPTLRRAKGNFIR
jgi:phosphoribosylformylglycinamidine synthase